MNSELDLLKKRITELEAENAKLRQTMKEKSDLEAENSKRKAENATIPNIRQNTYAKVKSLEDKKMDDFLDSVNSK